MPGPFAVDGIDHVELYVSDPEAAAAWYERVLGLTPDESFSQWSERGTGPLVLSIDAGGTKLALFERARATRGESVSPHRVAFRTGANGFSSFLDRLGSLDLTDDEDRPVTRDDVVDHRLTYSIYFTDPDGNRLELTTNDYERVSSELA